MRYLVFSVLFFLMLTACSDQQSYQEDAIRYFELNGTEKQYSDAIDQMYGLLQRQFDAQGVPNAVWEELQNDKEIPLSNIKSLLVPAYEINYSHEDIKSLIVFYESDTGKQMLVDPTKLSEDQKSKLSQFFSSDIGQKVQNQNDSLKTLVGEISQSWSKNLYEETVQKLETKGFKLP